MSLDIRAFRNALGCFATGIAVVTAKGDDQAAEAKGITVNSFSSVSLEPPLVLWCLGKTSKRYDLFTKPDKFTISILSEAQRAISERLAVSTDCSLAGLPLVECENGAPGLAHALAIFECRREAMHEAGDHVILVGHVMRFEARDEGDPLLYFRGRYGALTSK